MEKFAALAGFTTKASAKSNHYKVLKKVLPKDAAASPEGEKKVGGRKSKAGEYFWSDRVMHGALLTMYQTAAMDSDRDDGAGDTPSNQTKKGADGSEEASTVKEEALNGDDDGSLEGWHWKWRSTLCHGDWNLSQC